MFGIDFETLTLGEIDTLEKLSEQSVESLGDEDTPKSKLLAALMFIISRRKGEPMKWAECLNTPYPRAAEYLGIGQDDDTDADQDEADEDAEDAEDAAPVVARWNSSAEADEDAAPVVARWNSSAEADEDAEADFS